MKRICCNLLIIVALLSGCGFSQESEVFESQSEFLNEPEEWTLTDQVNDLSVKQVVSDQEGGVWLLTEENSIIRYSAKLTKDKELDLGDSIDSICCYKSNVFLLSKDDEYTISQINADSEITLSCSIDANLLGGQEIEDFCCAAGNWLLRLADTSLILVDKSGKLIKSFNVMSTSAWQTEDGAGAMEYDLQMDSYNYYSIKSNGDYGKTVLDFPSTDNYFRGAAVEENTFFFSDGNVYTLNNSEVEPFCKISFNGRMVELVPSEDYMLVITNNSIFLFESPEVLSAEEKEGVDQRSNASDLDNNSTISLVLATAFNGYVQDDYIKQAVRLFNASQDEITISIKDYQAGNATEVEAMENLNLDLAAGDGPDIIDTAAFSADIYARNGTLIPLDAMAAQDVDASLYHPNLTEALTLYDHIYSIATAYQIQCLAVDNRYLATASKDTAWDIAGFLAQIDQVPENVCLFDGDAETYLSYWCDNCISDYISGTNCNFNSSSFIELLETANKMYLGEYDYSATSILTIRHVDGFRQMQVTKEGTLENNPGYVYMGMPSDYSNGVALDPIMSFGISAQSSHADSCWLFLKYLLNDDFQRNITNAIPVKTTILEEEIEAAETTSDNPLTEAQADALVSIINQADHLYGLYPDVKAIVLEEAEAFFSGDKTATEVADIIQSRVSIYLGEQG